MIAYMAQFTRKYDARAKTVMIGADRPCDHFVFPIRTRLTAARRATSLTRGPWHRVTHGQRLRRRRPPPPPAAAGRGRLRRRTAAPPAGRVRRVRRRAGTALPG